MTNNSPTFEFLTGQAGTGKTTELQNRMRRFRANCNRSSSSSGGFGNNGSYGRDYAVLTATTGIAAINLSGGNLDGDGASTVTTLNSRLGYFNSEDLVHKLKTGKLVPSLKRLSKLANILAVEEVSMMDKIQLDTLYEGVQRVNELPEVFNRGGLGILLVGDFMQLPPIKARYAFEAQCFRNFKITKLEKIWRQTDIEFLKMMNAARSGDGVYVSHALYDLQERGIKVTSRVDPNFDGTTLVPVNKEVDEINEARLKQLLQADAKANTLFEFPTNRWGKQRSEWKIIPEVIRVCKNAYVMILANDAPDFTYANGSCGHVVDANIDNKVVFVRLKENSREVRVRKVTRKYTQRETPEGQREPESYMSRDDFEKEWRYGTTYTNRVPTVDSSSDSDTSVDNDSRDDSNNNKGRLDISEETLDAAYKAYLISLTTEHRSRILDDTPINAPYFDYVEEKWVIGEISYVPVRLAYASTCHKSQGLSLDVVQIDFSHEFFGAPSMAYVALSRCRTPEGLTVIGNRKVFEDRTNISSEVLAWV